MTVKNPLSVLPLSAELLPHRFPCAQLPVLLICALNDRWNGERVLTTDDDDTIQLSFERGALASLTAPEAEEFHWKLISERLPSEHLAFARDYAKNQSTGALATLQRLVLLPDDVLRQVHEAALFEQIHHFSKKLGYFRYDPEEVETRNRPSWVAGATQNPLAMISDCLLRSLDLAWCREALSESSDERLELSGRFKTRGTSPASTFSKVVEAIAAKPESLQSLGLRNLVTDDALLATVYVLVATGSATFPLKHRAPGSVSSRSQAPTVPISQKEGANSTPRGFDEDSLSLAQGSQSKPASGGSPTSASGVRRMSTTDLTNRPLSSRVTPGPGPSSAGPSSAGPSSAGPSSAGPSSLNETSAEANCLKAWMRAEGDPSVLPRALTYITKARRHFPLNPSILFYLGSVQTLLGNTRVAEETLDRVLELDPKHSEAARTLRHLRGSDGAKKLRRPGK